MTNKVLLKLYITGQTPRSEQAVVNLRRICEQQLRSNTVRIEPVDAKQLNNKRVIW
jgi:hypothetical protein